MELGLESTLAGRAGDDDAWSRRRAGWRSARAPRSVPPPVPGDDVVLTLDREIQATTERVLGNAVQSLQRRGRLRGRPRRQDRPGPGDGVDARLRPGRAARLDARGPQEPRRHRRLRARQRQQGHHRQRRARGRAVASPTRSSRCRWATGSADKVFHDSHAPEKPKLTFREIIEQSSNVGTIRIAERVGPKRLYQYLRKFGYGTRARHRLPRRVARAAAAPPTQWSDDQPADDQHRAGRLRLAAAGRQRVPDHRLAAASGSQPTLVRGTVGEDGRLQPRREPERRRVVSARDRAGASPKCSSASSRTSAAPASCAPSPATRSVARPARRRRPSDDHARLRGRRLRRLLRRLRPGRGPGRRRRRHARRAAPRLLRRPDGRPDLRRDHGVRAEPPAGAAVGSRGTRRPRNRRHPAPSPPARPQAAATPRTSRTASDRPGASGRWTWAPSRPVPLGAGTAGPPCCAGGRGRCAGSRGLARMLATDVRSDARLPCPPRPRLDCRHPVTASAPADPIAAARRRCRVGPDAMLSRRRRGRASSTSRTTAARSAPGVLFACRPGARSDGHDHAPAAVAAGAPALLVERPSTCDVPQLHVPSVAEAHGPGCRRGARQPVGRAAAAGRHRAPTARRRRRTCSRPSSPPRGTSPG